MFQRIRLNHFAPVIFLLFCLHCGGDDSTRNKEFFRIKLSGSYYIGAICKDGIIVGADSRGTFLDGNNNVMAYFDTVQKVFALKRCIVSVAGLIAVGDRFVSDYLTEFEKTLPDSITPSEILSKLEFFFRTKYPDNISEFGQLHIVSYGFSKSDPVICAMDLRQCVLGSGVATGDSLTLFSSKYDAEFCRKHTCIEIAPLIEREIKKYAINQRIPFKVGGPIMIVQVRLNGKISWMRNKPKRPNWRTINDFISEYQKGRIEIHFRSDEFRKDFMEKHPVYK
jgi:hypothetical protein